VYDRFIVPADKGGVLEAVVNCIGGSVLTGTLLAVSDILT
jgi:hypothetical protein